MMSLAGSKSECIVVFSGSVRIMEAEEIFRGLKEVLDQGNPLVVLDLEALEDLDVTFLQLLLSFKKSLELQGGHLMVQALPSDHVANRIATLVGVPLSQHFVLVGAPR